MKIKKAVKLIDVKEGYPVRHGGELKMELSKMEESIRSKRDVREMTYATNAPFEQRLEEVSFKVKEETRQTVPDPFEQERYLSVEKYEDRVIPALLKKTDLE